MHGKWFRDADLWARMKPAVKALRRNGTPAEQVLWEHLRANQVQGLKFRRQHPIGRYIADFCCPARKIVIELDGGIHQAQVEEDQQRQVYLEQRGYCVLRFKNEEVLESPEPVVARIKALADRSGVRR